MASTQVTNAQPDFFGIIDETKSYLYNELWKLSAGPLLDLPKFGEKVYYFPQGHIEQLEASTNDELAQMKPLFDLPSKIRCNVIDIQLKVENETNEIYAQVTLLPDTVELGIPIPDGNQESPKFYSFAKVLSASDTSTHGSLSVLRKHAIECLPSLDMSHPTPTQEIVAKDLLGYEWKFKHSFRGTPRRHLLTTGWSAFVTAKKLVVGDCFIFIRGENGELGVGIRRAVHQRGNIPSSVISTQSMYHGIIVSALNAINTKCMFVVFYKPRSSQFVASFDKFLDAVNNKFNVGSRFAMQFEGTDFIQIRYSGTIIGVQDFSPHWKDSEWRSLVVQWDEAASIPRPDKVSPWEIEKLPPSSIVPQSSLLKNKRLRQVDEIGSNLWTPTLTQGQEIGQSSMNAPMSIPHLSYHDATDDSKIPSGFLMSYSAPPMFKPNYNDQMALPMKEKITTNATISYRLFGVDMTIPKVGPIDSYQNSEISKVSEEKKLDQTHTLTSPKTIQSKHINFTRSRTKVQMQGVAIGRAVDLTVLDGYNELIGELEKLFDLKDELHTRIQWEIVFTDDEGDMLLVGDDPWPEFCNKVKKILICSKEKVKKMKSGNTFSESDSALTTTI